MGLCQFVLAEKLSSSGYSVHSLDATNLWLSQHRKGNGKIISSKNIKRENSPCPEVAVFQILIYKLHLENVQPCTGYSAQ